MFEWNPCRKNSHIRNWQFAQDFTKCCINLPSDAISRHCRFCDLIRDDHGAFRILETWVGFYDHAQICTKKTLAAGDSRELVGDNSVGSWEHSF